MMLKMKEIDQLMERGRREKKKFKKNMLTKKMTYTKNLLKYNPAN